MSYEMSSEQLRDEEEALRKQIRELTPEQRKEYFRLEGEQIKDPDTYAVLNWLVMAGLHHFYLGKTQRGVINLCVMLLGLVLLPFFLSSELSFCSALLLLSCHNCLSHNKLFMLTTITLCASSFIK